MYSGSLPWKQSSLVLLNGGVLCEYVEYLDKYYFGTPAATRSGKGKHGRPVFTFGMPSKYKEIVAITCQWRTMLRAGMATGMLLSQASLSVIDIISKFQESSRIAALCRWQNRPLTRTTRYWRSTVACMPLWNMLPSWTCLRRWRNSSMLGCNVQNSLISFWFNKRG